MQFAPLKNETSDTLTPLMLDRRARIAEMVRLRGSVRVQDLADLFQVSTVTIRTDLMQLEKDGLLLRDRGGAVAAEQRSALVAFDQRATLFPDRKQRIGQAAARLVAPGDTILLDAGTTVVEMIKHMHGTPNLTVVTNGLNVSLELRSLPSARVMLLGGTINYETLSTLGPQVSHDLETMVVQKLFLGTESVDLIDGVTDSTMEIAQIKRAMIRAARQVVLLADSSKWGREGFLKIAPLNAINTIISDTDLPASTRRELEHQGISVMLV